MAKTSSIPTVREIAAHCGVSQATVSRVLNGNYKHGFSVRKELRQKITQVAKELGYRPNLAAQNLVQRQTNIVAVLGCNTVYGWPSNIYQVTIEAAVRFLQGHNYDICITAPNLERDDTELPPWRVDGVIVLQECSPETIEQMEKIELPYVVVNGVGGPHGDTVVPDDVEATRCAIEHLVELGHRRIAYAGPTPQHRRHASIQDRHQTYLSELQRRGLECVSGHEGIFRDAAGFMASVLKNRATAILAYDHVIALKILHEANQRRIPIPDQVSLICFNDEYLCDVVTPPLTTMGIPSRQIGQTAARMLLEQIQAGPEKRPPEHVKMRQELILRSSTAAPAKSPDNAGGRRRIVDIAGVETGE